jgi:hypothetical protein
VKRDRNDHICIRKRKRCQEFTEGLRQAPESPEFQKMYSLLERPFIQSVTEDLRKGRWGLRTCRATNGVR